MKIKILKTVLSIVNIVNIYAVSDVKVRDHYHVRGGSAHKECNIKIKLNHKIHIISHNVRNYDSHLNMQVVKLNSKINITLNWLKNIWALN